MNPVKQHLGQVRLEYPRLGGGNLIESCDISVRIIIIVLYVTVW